MTLSSQQMPAGPGLVPFSGQRAQSLVIFLHGYGADGNDLIGLAQVMAPYLPDTAFVSPHAPEPCAMSPLGGRQWFPLTLRDPSEYWRGVKTAEAGLKAFIEKEAAAHDLPLSRVALVGFSQGTMMALHVGFRLPDHLAAIVGFSGLLAGAEHLGADLISRAPVLLVHGDRDEVVPVQSSHFASQVIGAEGCENELHIIEGLGHGINQEGLTLATEFLRRHFGVI